MAVRRTASGSSTLTYLHGDSLGSVSVATIAGGGVVNQQEFDPWGKPRSGDIPETNRDYTGQLRYDTLRATMEWHRSLPEIRFKQGVRSSI